MKAEAEQPEKVAGEGSIPTCIFILPSAVYDSSCTFQDLLLLLPLMAHLGYILQVSWHCLLEVAAQGRLPLCTHKAASHVPALYVPVRQPVVFIVQDVQHCLGGSSPTSFQDACFALEVEPPSLTGPPNKLTLAHLHFCSWRNATPRHPFLLAPLFQAAFLLRHSPWAYHCGCACGSPGSWRWDNSSCTVGRGRPAHWGRPP